MNIRPAVPGFTIRTDGQRDEQTDRDTTKFIVAFQNFANAPTKPTTSCY